MFFGKKLIAAALIGGSLIFAPNVYADKHVDSVVFSSEKSPNEKNQLMENIAKFTEIIKLNPNDAEAYNNRGKAYYNLHTYSFGSYRDFDDYGVDLSNYKSAVANFTSAIELNPNFAEAYFNRGNIYRGLKQYEQAVSDLSKAIEINPNYDLAYLVRGSAYEDSGDYGRAIADFTKAIELDPDNELAYLGRAYCYKALGDTEKFESDLAMFEEKFKKAYSK